MRSLRNLLTLLILFPNLSHASILGEETAVLLQIAGNQLTELNRLAENIGIARDQRNLLVQINEGVDRATYQIRSIESIIERAQGVDPLSVRNLSQLNQTIEDLKYISSEVQELILIKLLLCDQAVEEASLQSDTSYKMGQEMADLGAKLSQEAKSASPGRAQQISASAASAQMLAMGVELQTLSQISQLLALSLDLQKTQMEREFKFEKARRTYFKHALVGNKTTYTRALAAQQKPKRQAKL